MALAARIGLAALALGAGSAATTVALANYYRVKAPSTAVALFPGDGRALGALARGELEEAPADPEAQQAARRDAVAALLADPTAVPAAATLGLLAEANGAASAARRAFHYGERLSRRDLSTELWLIEDAVRRQDVADALHHYDVALRTQPGASDILFPVLAQASIDPPIGPALEKTLLMRPVWVQPFLGFLASQSTRPDAVADLFEQLQRRGLTVEASPQVSLIGRLIAANRIDRAWAYYAALHPGVTRDRARDPNFAAPAAVPTAFDWQTVDDAGVAATIQRGATSGVVTFSAPPSVGGGIVQQLQLLPPGRYRLSGTSEGIDQSPQERPYWLLRCVADGRELGRVALPNSDQQGGAFAGMVSVDKNCPVQNLILIASPSTAPAGSSGALTAVRLVPDTKAGNATAPENVR